MDRELPSSNLPVLPFLGSALVFAGSDEGTIKINLYTKKGPIRLILCYLEINELS